MKYKTFEFDSQLSTEAGMDQIQQLLAKEGVGYKASELTVTSVRTPIVVLGIQPLLYTHRNWFGLNPFVFISGVEVRFEAGARGLTKVTVSVNRVRAFLLVAFWVMCSFLVGTAMPEPGGVIIFVGVTCVAWFGIVSFLGGYLVRKEISDSLEVV